jgi:hypothetical protein
VPAPTVVLQQLASANTAIGTGAGATVTRAFTSVTVAVGDRICVEGRTEDGDFHYTGVAKTAGTATLVATPTRDRTTGVASTSCGNDLFTCVVNGAGTLTLTCTITHGGVIGSAVVRNGATLLVATGAAATNSFLSTTARQITITPASTNSFIATFTADWSAAASNGASFVPAGQGQVIDVRATDGVDQQASAGSSSSVFAAHWTDTAGAGSTAYGLNSPSAGTYTTTAVEFTGTGGAAPVIPMLTTPPMRR